MRQLRNFSESKPKQTKEDNATTDSLNKFNGMDEDALINQLMQTVKNSKNDGTYDSAQLQNFVAMMSPHLTEVQLGKLTALIRVLDNE